MANFWEKGDRIVLSAVFTTNALVPTDPTVVTASIVPPNTTTPQALTVVRSVGSDFPAATGTYYAVFDIAIMGAHSYEFVGTGAVQRTVSAWFGVKSSPF